ncbi:zinc-binding dehydrogenase [Streptomyces sp. NPDC096191]|uniref:zinc-binding dehydrogenase n=1 Tax=Streptomyces sp. NPDC096191 TaxID=3155426 RepID=UPI00331A4D19
MLARDLGATHIVNPGQVEDLTGALRAIDERGMEYVLDTSGRAENLDAGVGALAPLGRFGFGAFHEGAGAMTARSASPEPWRARGRSPTSPRS